MVPGAARERRFGCSDLLPPPERLLTRAWGRAARVSNRVRMARTDDAIVRAVAGRLPRPV